MLEKTWKWFLQQLQNSDKSSTFRVDDFMSFFLCCADCRSSRSSSSFIHHPVMFGETLSLCKFNQFKMNCRLPSILCRWLPSMKIESSHWKMTSFRTSSPSDLRLSATWREHLFLKRCPAIAPNVCAGPIILVTNVAFRLPFGTGPYPKSIIDGHWSHEKCQGG